jgi:class 3 adenylate cyclase
MAMLFADAKGFSGLSDGEVVKFLDHFLTLVADCVEKHARRSGQASDLWSDTEIPVRETWGDGLYFAIRDVRTAGLFALDLCEAIQTTHWQRDVGLAREMQIRIALHCGPVHLGRDPVTGLPKCTGTHVSRAARLEPSTPPNHVYASDAFAALAAERHITEFTCEFAKLLDWAKDHGTYPTYVVRRGVSNERCSDDDQCGS